MCDAYDDSYQYELAEEDGREHERELVVEYLREMAQEQEEHGWPPYAGILLLAASNIENKEHT